MVTLIGRGANAAQGFNGSPPSFLLLRQKTGGSEGEGHMGCEELRAFAAASHSVSSFWPLLLLQTPASGPWVPAQSRG